MKSLKRRAGKRYANDKSITLIRGYRPAPKALAVSISKGAGGRVEGRENTRAHTHAYLFIYIYI